MKPISSDSLSSIRVLDGGLATELERRGCDLSGALWSARILDEAPEIISQVHLDYLRAGADCISTASYQVSAFGYLELGRDPSEADDALKKSVDIALAARDEYRKESSRPVFIAASLGPYGAALHNGAEFHGRYDISFDQLVQFHSERLAVISTTSADLVALETVPSLEEAKAITAALSKFSNVSAWISFTCKDESTTAHGEQIGHCAAFLQDVAQVVAIGVNCTQPGYLSTLIPKIRSSSSKPIFVYPNSGELWDAENHSWYESDGVTDYTRWTKEWYAFGAQSIGGCCRTTPAQINRISSLQANVMPEQSPVKT